MSSGIYKITNTVNGKFYIGSAVSFIKRKRCHLSTLRSGKHRNEKLQRAFFKYGEDAFVFSLILKCNVDDLLFYEQLIIDALNPIKNGYNICPEAGNWSGRKHSEETKKKMKDAWKERRKKPRNPMSEEAREKIRLSKLGKKRKPFTDEAKKNMSMARIGNKNRLGIPHTEETKLKMKLIREQKKEKNNVCPQEIDGSKN